MYQSGCEAAERGADAEDHEEQAARLRGEHREEPVADDVVLGPPRAWELGVLLLDQDQQVHGDQAQQDRREEQHVGDVEAADDVLADVVAVEDREVHPGTHDGDRQQDGADDPEPGTGQEVVGERVAGDAHEEGQHQHDDTDEPVGLARAAERTGEEDAQQVHDDRGHEQQRGPVVDLAHEEPAADVEGHLQGGVVRRRHLDPAQRRVGAVVDDLLHGGVEEEGQVRTRQQQDDERVERDLAQQERPVVGEDLVQRAPERAGDDEPVVDLERGLAETRRRRAWCGCGASHQMRSRFQYVGPTASM